MGSTSFKTSMRLLIKVKKINILGGSVVEFGIVLVEFGLI